MSHFGVNSSIIQSLCCLTWSLSQCVPEPGIHPLGYFSLTPLSCSYNTSIVEAQHSTATLPPGCLLFMLPKCLKTDGEGNSQTQTLKHSDSVSSLEAYIRYRSLTWAWCMNHKVTVSICLAVSSRLSWCKVFLSLAWNSFDNCTQMARLSVTLINIMLHRNVNE